MQSVAWEINHSLSISLSGQTIDKNSTAKFIQQRATLKGQSRLEYLQKIPVIK
jgi:hypothetical protein